MEIVFIERQTKLEYEVPLFPFPSRTKSAIKFPFLFSLIDLISGMIARLSGWMARHIIIGGFFVLDDSPDEN